MRDPERPLGRLSRTGRGIGKLASTIHFFVIYEGAQHVFVDDAGHVFSAGTGMLYAERMCASHADWMIGTYRDASAKRRGASAESIRALIAADLSLRIDELCARAPELREVAA